MTAVALRLQGLRVAVTQADVFMGPAVTALFRQEGARVLEDVGDPTDPAHADQLVAGAGPLDVVVINLMERNTRTTAHETSDEDWARMFDVMVHPLHRIVRAVLPQMIDRRAGKIVVMGSANGLRGTSLRSAYSAARGAQLAYVRAAGAECAPLGITINAIAQNWVANPTSYPPAVTETEAFKARLAEVPLGRVARGSESAALALVLASRDSDVLAGQVIPFAGGWV